MTAVYVLAAGGTGGHLFPAQALARELTARQARIVVMTDGRGHSYGAAFPGSTIETVPAATPAGRSPLGKVKAMAVIVFGVAVAWLKLARMNPRAVVGFGGYPSLPVMLAAWIAGIPTVLHEQNAIVGRVNRLLLGRVTRIAAALPFTGTSVPQAERVTITGNPVRDQAVALADAGYTAPRDGEPVHILISGGSQGAHALSVMVPQALTALPVSLRTRLRVVQQCRADDVAGVTAAYEAAGIAADVAAFYNDLPQRMAWSHLVISRAGASTIAELTVIGRPAILIPYPHAMDDHQAANASVLEKAGAAWAVRQSDLDPEKLCDLIGRIFSDPETMEAHARAARRLGRPDAAARLADLVEQTGARR
jgi:UDP-N-acetylglucosamine--N-acetylmuramyl-(pentapeptide) pyrophosphoryl-undecaprenol N-acetylglucosamine transferase